MSPTKVKVAFQTIPHTVGMFWTCTTPSAKATTAPMVAPQPMPSPLGCTITKKSVNTKTATANTIPPLPTRPDRPLLPLDAPAARRASSKSPFVVSRIHAGRARAKGPAGTPFPDKDRADRWARGALGSTPLHSSITGVARDRPGPPPRPKAVRILNECIAARGCAQGGDDRRHPWREVRTAPVVRPRAMPAHGHKSSGAHRRKMARDDRLRHAEGGGKIAYAKLPEGLEQHKEASPGGVAQYRKKIVLGCHAPIIFPFLYMRQHI